MTINMTLYRLLKQLPNVTDAEAEAAARIDASELATKADLAGLKADLIMWNVGTILAVAAIVAGLLVALR